MAGKNKNTGLGKGLEALFGEIEGSVGVGDGKTDNSSLEIDINEIKPNAGQPRKTFDKDALRELADSIRENGLIQPIIVRKSGSVYEIVAGERRWRACRLAGLEKIPCIVRELTDKELMLFAIIENMQRENLNPIEEAEGLASMMNSYGLTQLQISKSVGKSRPYIANSLRLLKLSSEVRALMQEGSLSGGHGKALLKISSKSPAPCCRTCAAAAAVFRATTARRLPDFLRGPKFSTGCRSRRSCTTRSEERRVGKECRSRWSPYH